MSNKIIRTVLITLGVAFGLFAVSMITLLLWIFIMYGSMDSYSRAQLTDPASYVQIV